MTHPNTLLHQPVTRLKGVGDHLASKLKKLGITELQDLLFHLPLRYQDRTHLTPIAHLTPQQDAVIEGEIIKCDIVYGKRRSLLCMLQDNSGRIALRFFHFSQAQKQNLSPGTCLRCYGEVRRGSSGLEMYHPETQRYGESTPEPLAQTLTPIYPTTEGLTQPRLRNVIQQALVLTEQQTIAELVPHLIPEKLVVDSKHTLNGALQFLHSPPKNSDLSLLDASQHPAQLRLAFEELLAHHLSLLRLRALTKTRLSIGLPQHNQLIEQFLQQLPFQLTAAQQRVVAEIKSDLAATAPMTRLLQGDVGSGKTVVAALSALQAIAQHQQVALMAPTEILATQHYRTLKNWFEPIGIEVAWLSGKQTSREKKSNLESVADGSAKLIVGTHALIQEDVCFSNLALIIVDEQHRFGVQQRLTLRNKGIRQDANGDTLFPHQLIMTATPIPRTLAMSMYADMDVSVINELPPGRTPVNTLLIANTRRDEVTQRIATACQQGRQVYWVCTLIEESESLEAQAAESTAQQLQQALPDVRIALVHSRIKAKEKDRIMQDFKANNIDLLVATTVIEVGVDVPNASLMIIENPERLGLAQLHQLRGRVGRGSVESHCMLLYGSPLSQLAKQRLQVMRSSNDGFYIAEEDLKIRGPGEVLGTRQTGTIEFKIADLQQHAHLHTDVKKAAQILLGQQSPTVEALIRRWLGDKPEFAQA